MNILEKKEIEENWFLIVIRDENFLVGESFVKLLKIIQPILGLQLSQFDTDLEGISKTTGFWQLLEENQGLLPIDECENFLSKVDLEWGNIFLFKNVPMTWDTSLKKKPLEKIAETQATIRAADSNFILIYSKDEHLYEEIKSDYPDSRLDKDKLEKLWYPC